MQTPRKLFFLLLPLLWATPAWASGFNASLASNDELMGILSSTIGPAINTVTGQGNGTVSMVTTALLDLNDLVLILGGLILSYTVFSSIMKTAHEGEPLGQKWSSMWIPMKTAIGAALILPVSTLGGLSAAQGVVIWMLSFGIGSADALWDQVISSIAQNPVGSVIVNPAGTGQMAQGIMESQVCELAMNATADNLWPGANPVSRTGPTAETTLTPVSAAAHVFQGYNEAVQPLPGGSVYVTNYSIYQWTADSGGLLGDLSSLGLNPAACGKTAYVSGALGSGTGASLINTVGSDNGTAINTLIGALKPVSTNVYDETGTGTNDAAFIAAINAYDSTMQTDIQNAASTAVSAQVTAYETAAQADGFATAGEWFWDIVQWNEIAQRTADGLGNATGMNPGGFLGKMFSSHLAHADARIAAFEKRNASLTGPQTPSANATGDISSVMQPATSMLVAGIEASPSENPLINIRNIGIGMEVAGSAVYATDVLLVGSVATADGASKGTIANLAEAQTVAEPANEIVLYTVSPLLLMIAGLLFVEGFFLSFVVPLIPFMTWIAGILGFLFLAFEFIVAAPIWGIMHMHPEGHDVVGFGAAGYKMALAIVCRPFLMVLGLIGGYALFMGFTALVTPMVTHAIVSSQDFGGGIMGPLDLIGVVGVYVTLMVIIAYECFKLVFVLPERVMNWASAGVQNYGEEGVVGKQQQAHGTAKGQAGKGHDQWIQGRPKKK